MSITLHQFILKTYNETEFYTLCDNYFDEVNADFSVVTPFGEKVRILIAFCKRRGYYNILWEKVKEERKEQWAFHNMPDDKPNAESQTSGSVNAPTKDFPKENNGAESRTKRPLKVFLCHSSNDKPAVLKLYEYLRQKGG